MFDFSTVPETACATPTPSGGPADQSQQAAVVATAGTGCFNWGYGFNGSGTGSFNPYIRDAVRGGSGFDTGNALVANQGWINGQNDDPNASGTASVGDLMWAGDVIKASMAGSIRSYSLTTSRDAQLPLKRIDIGGSPLGFVTDPSESVTYVENHDNQTLSDNNAYKLPLTTTQDDRDRVQMLGAAVVSFSQGVAYYHAGIDTLRSKSLDKNTYDSGDWFNRLDWSYADNNFGVRVWGSGLAGGQPPWRLTNMR